MRTFLSSDDTHDNRHSTWGLDTAEPADEWKSRGLCAQTDPEAFFPEKGGTTAPAKRICQGCEVRDACLQAALDNDERFGIWGGLSERERRRMKRGEHVIPSTGSRARYENNGRRRAA